MIDQASASNVEEFLIAGLIFSFFQKDAADGKVNERTPPPPVVLL